MKNRAKNSFYVLVLYLLVVSFTSFSMDTFTQEETDPEYIPNPTIIIDPCTPTGVREMINNWIILAKAETNKYSILIGRIHKISFPSKTELLCFNKRTMKTFRFEPHTPNRHCATYDRYDAIFSHDGSKFCFVEYDDDSGDLFTTPCPLLRMAVVDLHKRTMEQFFIDGDIASFKETKLVALSSDGKLLARLIKDARLPQKIIIDQLVCDDYSNIFIFDLDNPLDATQLCFAPDNKRLFIQSALGSKVFDIQDGSRYGWTHNAYEKSSAAVKTVTLSSLLPRTSRHHTKPFIGLCDEAACKIIKENFPSFQPHDLVLYNDILWKKTYFKLVPVKIFTQQSDTLHTLFDGTQVRFCKNDALTLLFCNDNDFETTLFTYTTDSRKHNPPIVLEQPRTYLAQKLKKNGSLICDNKHCDEPVSFKYAILDTDHPNGTLAGSVIANHRIAKKILALTLGK